MQKWAILLVVAVILAACSNTDDQQPTESLVTFQDMDVTTTNQTAQLTAKAKTNNDRLYYTFKQGDTVLVDERDGGVNKFV
ncbi:hypothetical protein GCM10008983_13680 [Lentibacillus halophilus]|uniref:Uncharacterized protein n=1 Tax=Lentibacillus halophilus TaxID=295065 RepID=A0ABN0Z833_9BACI